MACPHLDSAWAWAENTRQLIARKRYGPAGRRRMTALAPDLDQARRFLTLLDEEAPAFTFQTATDAEPKPNPDHLARMINLPPDNLKALADPQRQRRGRVGDDQRGRRQGAHGPRTSPACGPCSPTWTARRSQPVMACELEPHVVVESLAGRFHAYWLVDGPAARSVRGRAAPDRHDVQRRPRHRSVPGDAAAGHDPRQGPRQAVPGADRAPGRAPALSGGRHPAGVPAARAWQGKAENGAGEAIDLPHQPPEPLSHARLAALKESHGHLFDLDRYDGHHSQRDLALAGVAARLGWPIADAWALIIRLREGLDGKEGHKAYRRDYIASTLALAYRDVEPEDDQQSAERIERLIEQAAADPGAAFESGSVDFLAALRARDPAAYERARARLKKAHVRVGVLDQEVERRKPETGRQCARARRSICPSRSHGPSRSTAPS